MNKNRYGHRIMLEDDLEFVLHIHRQAFPKSFLTFLGAAFLRRLYKNVLLDPSGIAFVVEADGEIGGFVVGSDQPQGFYKRLLLRRWWQFGFAALPALLRKPGILPRLLGALGLPNQPDAASNCGLLMAIAVAPEHQGKGIGKRLVTAFIEEASKRGLQHVSLTTEAKDNQATNNFYLEAGFRLHRTLVTPQGSEMNEYVISLSEPYRE